MKDLQSEQSKLLYEAILSLRTDDECRRFFEDICTVKELQAMIQRFQVAVQLDAGRNYSEVYDDTGVSSATICRVNKCLQYGEGGYRTALERLKQEGKITDGNKESETE